MENLFKKKVRAIKEKSALFFAKLEMKLEANNKEVDVHVCFGIPFKASKLDVSP